jgi:surface protein
MSNWDVSKVTNMSHMFADCYKLAEIKMDNWKTTSLVSMDAIFNNCGSVKVFDLSSFETSTVKEFSQMFDACYALEKIIGLEDWDTSSGITFEEMFSGCHVLKELDLSSFDTSSAYDGYTTINGDRDYRGFRNMFSGAGSLQKLVLGEKFSFKGNGKAAPVSFPNPGAVDGQAAVWYNAENDSYYAASEIPEGVAATYVAAPKN